MYIVFRRKFFQTFRCDERLFLEKRQLFYIFASSPPCTFPALFFCANLRSTAQRFFLRNLENEPKHAPMVIDDQISQRQSRYCTVV